jgi:TonB family protein
MPVLAKPAPGPTRKPGGAPPQRRESTPLIFETGDSAHPSEVRRAGRGQVWLATVIGLALALLTLAAWHRAGGDGLPRAEVPDEGLVSTEQSAVVSGEESGTPAVAVQSRVPLDQPSSASTSWLSTPHRGPWRHLSFEPARLVKDVRPVYPAAARRAGIEGLVIITYSLDASGRPIDLLVTKSVPGLDEAALSALRQWEYTPPPFGSAQRYRFNAQFELSRYAP